VTFTGVSLTGATKVAFLRARRPTFNRGSGHADQHDSSDGRVTGKIQVTTPAGLRERHQFSPYAVDRLSHRRGD